MKAKELAYKVLQDIYKNLDEYCKDVIRCEHVDIEFKGFYLKGLKGEKKYIKNLEDVDNLEDFDVKNREYWIKSINLKDLDRGILIISLSSKDSKDYKFLKKEYKIYNPKKPESWEFRERILKWMELSEEEMDKKVIDFDKMADEILTDINKDIKKDIYVYMDVFMNESSVDNYIEEDENKVIIWIHPVYIFSNKDVIKGLLAYELSKYNEKIFEKHYKDILNYCREVYKLTNYKPKILKKIKDIALKNKDTKTLKEIEEFEKI